MSKETMIGLSGLAIFLIVGLTFCSNARNALICYDDYDYIVTNRAIQHGLTPHSIYWSFKSAGYAGNWHPLTWMSHAFDFTIAENLQWKLEDGSCPFSSFIHSENIILHCVNAFLLWLLLIIMLAPCGKPLSICIISPFSLVLASFFTLFWAVHPLRVEVVAWAAERKELLCVLFMLLTLILYTQDKVDRRIPVASFALGLLAKPVAVSLPALILFYDLAFRGRTFKDAVRSICPYAGLSAATCYLTMISQKIALETGQTLAWGTKIRCAVEAPIIYLSQTIWPARLCLDYLFPDNSSLPIFILGIVLILAMAVVALRWLIFRRGKLAPMLIVWSYVGLIPMLGIVKVGYEPHNDRYTYWVGCGVVCCAALAFVRLKPILLRHAKLCIGTGVIVILLLSVLSFRQSCVWKNNEAILADISAKTYNEDAVRSLCELRVLRDGETANAEAESLLRETLRRRQSHLARTALAIHLLGYGTEIKPTDEVRQLVDEAQEEKPDSTWVRAAKALIDFNDKKYDDAVANMKFALDNGYLSALVKVNLRDWELLSGK